MNHDQNKCWGVFAANNHLSAENRPWRQVTPILNIQGPKPNFLFKSNFDMKLKPSDAFFDALNISGLNFEVRVQINVKFQKIEF